MRLGGRGERAALAVGERTYLRRARERDANERKSMNTHLHLVEAFAEMLGGTIAVKSELN